MFELIPDWRAVARRAHSMWAFFLSLLLLWLPDLIYVLAGTDTNPRLWFWLAQLAIIYGILGRLLRQPSLSPRDTFQSPPWVAVLAVLALGAGVFLAQGGPVVVQSSPAAAVETVDNAPDPAAVAADPVYTQADFLAVAVPLVAKWEGLRTTAYIDPVGVLTVCYGETQGVRPGDTYTARECADMLGRRILEYRSGLHRYLTDDTRARRLTPHRDAAYASLAYNVGISAAGKSTAVRRLNAGAIEDGCHALTWWNKAGGRVLRGLVNRRAEERDLCLLGLAA